MPVLSQPIWTTTCRWIAFSPWVISPLTLSSISLTRLRLSILRRNFARVLGLGSLPLLWVKAAEAGGKIATARAQARGRGPYTISSLYSRWMTIVGPRQPLVRLESHTVSRSGKTTSDTARPGLAVAFHFGKPAPLAPQDFDVRGSGWA